MTGFSQPPDPDGDPVDAESPAAAPMTPDEPGMPEHDSATPGVDDDQDDPDALPRGQHGPTLDLK